MQLLVFFICRWSSYGWRLRGRRLGVDFLPRDLGEAGREDWINEGRTVSVNVQLNAFTTHRPSVRMYHRRK